MRCLLLRASWITGIQPVEERRQTECLPFALGELTARRSTVMVAGTYRIENAVATAALDALSRRAHAF